MASRKTRSNSHHPGEFGDACFECGAIGLQSPDPPRHPKRDDALSAARLQEHDAGLVLLPPDDTRAAALAFLRQGELERAGQEDGAFEDELCPVLGHVPHEAIDRAVLIVERETPAEIGAPPLIFAPLPHTSAPYWHNGMVIAGLTASQGPSRLRSDGRRSA